MYSLGAVLHYAITGRPVTASVSRLLKDPLPRLADTPGLAISPAFARAIDRAWVGAILRQNGAVEETGLAAGVQGDPAIGIAWLANKLAPWGESLQAGQIVLAGSFTRPVAARVGDVFEADYGPLGRMTFKFV